MHVVVRHSQALVVDATLAEQQNVQIQRAWPPAFGLAHAALLLLDALQGIEQCPGL